MTATLRRYLTLAIIAAAVLFVRTGQARELVLGMQCDRSGPTSFIGHYTCDAVHDYIRLANSEGMFGEGNSLRVFEVDHGYNVPRGIEAYQRTKEAGHVSYAVYGTPQLYALIPRLTADQVPGTSPGFGSAGAANGKLYPYIFPASATYWSQTGTAVRYVLDRWAETKSDDQLKVAYLYYDNPAGREPLELLRELAAAERFELREFAVPPPGVDMRPQILDIARKYRADWILNHTFAKSPTIAIRELTRIGYPMDRVLGFAWAGAESDMEVAGWDVAEGYQILQFTQIGTDHDVLKRIRAMYEAEGEEPPERMKVSVYYNRGVLVGAIHVEAIRLAIEAVGADNVTGEDVRRGFESIHGFSLGGFLPPLTLTPEDHEGGGWLQVWQVRNGGWHVATPWMRGYRDRVLERVANAKPPSS